MAEAFEYIKFEIYNLGFGGTWVDVWDDVLKDPPPRGGVAILNNGFLDRTPDGNQLTFSLNNGDDNSQATRGYYSPINVLSAMPVRVTFQYDGRPKILLYYIAPDGVKVHSGILGPRRVDITARDWFGLAAEYKVNNLAYAVNQRIEEATALLVATLPAALQPQYTEYSTGDETFADVFDLTNGDTTVIAELNKLAVSEMGYIYNKPNRFDGLTLVVENRLKRRDVTANTSVFKTSAETTDLFLLANGTDNMLLANGTDKLLLTETQTISMTDADVWEGAELECNTGGNYANYSRVVTTPRVVDAAATTVLYTMEGSIKVAAGSSTATTGEILARYRDPNNRVNKVNCIQGTTPVANTDYKAFANADGTGTDLTANMSVSVTFETAQAKITITNTGGTDFYTGGDILFRLRGKGVYVYDTIDILIERFNGLAPYDGRRALDFNMPYFSRAEEAKFVVWHTLKDANNRSVFIRRYPLFANRDKKNMMAFMYLEPGARAAFSETMTTYNEDSFINGYEWEIIGKEHVVWYPCLFRDGSVSPF